MPLPAGTRFGPYDIQSAIGAGAGRELSAYTTVVRSHEWIDRRSLALHEAVAAKLEARPELLQVAHANLRRWLSVNPVPALREWQELLDRTPLPQLLALLRSPGDAAAGLRQSSPFAGVLSPQERQAILSRYDPRCP